MYTHIMNHGEQNVTLSFKVIVKMHISQHILQTVDNRMVILVKKIMNTHKMNHGVEKKNLYFQSNGQGHSANAFK